MKTKMRKITLIVLISLATGACSNGVADTAKAMPEKKIIRVRVWRVEPETFVQKLTLTASAKAGREVTIASESPGRVVEVNFDKGDKVIRGQILIRLDDATLKAKIAMATVDKDLAELEYRKQKTLSDQGGGISEFQLEQSRLRLEAAKARLRELDVELDKLTIKSPITGMILSRETEPGEIVSPGAPLARSAELRPIKVVTGAPELAIADFHIGKEALITFDAYPGKNFVGKVTFLSLEVNPRARTFDCEIELANDQMMILPEMSAKVSFTRKTLPGSILIPQTSVLELADGHAVFVVDANNIAHQRRVKLIDSADEKALVSSGLAEGDILVTLGHRNLIDGDTVRIEK